MKIQFTKFHTAGGDYLITDSPGVNRKYYASLAENLCNRHSGAGADGLVFVSASPCGHTDGDIIVLRPDGNVCAMSLSALLCSARYISERLCAGKTDLTIACGEAKLRTIILQNPSNPAVAAVTAEAGRVSFLPSEIPLSVNKPVIDRLTEVGNRIFRITALSCGFSPWAVLFTNDIQNCNTAQNGGILANHSLFSKKCDAVFVQETEIPGTLDAEAFVRGVGITRSECSAALAAVCAGVRLGRITADKRIRIVNDYGEMTAICGADYSAMISSDVSEVYRGEVSV